MTELWPHLPEVVATQEYEKLLAGSQPVPALGHPEQIYAPVGGRVAENTVNTLQAAVSNLAVSQGYPHRASDDQRIAFDRACAPLLRKSMNLSWAEAANRDLWSFSAVVVLPHVTLWRFGTANRERWIASDLTRHTWARLWWQAVVFQDDPSLLNALSESDLNQLLERRSIGGDPRLVRALGWAIVGAPSDAPRRALIRDATRRLRRWLAFVDNHALTDDQLQELCAGLIAETLRHIAGARDA